MEDGNADSVFLAADSDTRIPQALVSVFESIPYNTRGESEESLEVALALRCACCGDRLMEHTAIIISEGEIQVIACSGVCLDDVITLGYLTEQLEDVSDKINMRRDVGGRNLGDQPQEEDDVPENYGGTD